MRDATPDSSDGHNCPILQLKVRLLDVSPMIWRRLLVPSTMTLRDLHGVFQVAMGWRSLHLYQFRIHAVHYGSIELATESADRTLASFSFRCGAKIVYEYDMTDY